MNSAFLYKWTELSTGKWYIGSRTRDGCHINDGYICSSKIVLPKIKANPNDWKRDILEIGECEYIRNLESELLSFVDAKNLPQSYNLSNGSKDFYPSKGIPKSEEHKRKLRKPKPKYFKEQLKGKTPWNKNVKMSQEYCKKLSNMRKGKKKSQTHRERIGLGNSKEIMTPDGIFVSGTAAAKYYGIHPSSIRDRMIASPDKYYYIQKKKGGV